MGDQTDGTTYGDEQLPTAHGSARTGRGFAGVRERIGSRIAPAPDRQQANPEGYEGSPGARISTGEQVLGRGRERGKSSDSPPERATAADAQSAAKSTLSPLKLATRLASMGLGIDASMTPDEQRDIQEPLTRIYGRNPKIAGYINRYTDPVMLFTAIAVYVARIWLTMQQTRLVQAQTQLLRAQEQREQQRREQYPQQVTPIRPTPPAAPNAPTVEAKPEGPSAAELSSMMALGR